MISSRHDSGRGGGRVMAVLQIGHDVGDAPPAEAPLVVIGDVGREPSLQRIALKSVVQVVAAERRLGRVAGAAMAQTFDKIGAAIPFGGFRGVRLEFAALEIERVPDRHSLTNVERERQLVGNDGVANRLHRIEVSANGERVALGHLGVVRIGHRRVEQRAVMPFALAQRAHEQLVAPGADPGLAIGRDVGSHHDAERSLDRPAAGERLA